MPPGASPFPAVDGACLVDFSERAKLRLRGADRLRFLNGQVTNDVRRASADEALPACVLTAKGKLCADVFIVAGADFLQLDAAPELREPLIARLDRYLVADDVEIEDVTDDFGLLHVLGANVEALLARETAGQTMQPVRSRRLGQPGVDIFCARSALPALKQSLLADLGLREELDATTAEAMRIAAGVPRWGAELDENTLLPETGLELNAVDYAKGCYVGQEVVSRLKSVGHVNRHLQRLRGELAAGQSLPASGALLYPASDDATSAKEVGRLTSVAPAPDGTWSALGYVRRGHDAPGTQLRIGAAAEGQPTLATIVAPANDV